MMVSNKIRVVHLMTSFGGGISSFIFNKAIVLKDTNVIFDVITFDNVSAEFSEAIRNTGGTIHKVTSVTSNFKLFYREIDELFKKYDNKTILHSHFGMNLAIIFKVIAKKNSLNNFIIHAHTNYPKGMNSFKRIFNTIISSKQISCGEQASKNFFMEKVVKDNRVVVIPNSIDPKRYLNEPNNIKDINKELMIPNDVDFIIGHIGRFHEVKNHKFMINIIRKLSKMNYKFKWIFIGTGELESSIKKLVVDLNLEEYVIFLGRREDVPELLKIMDIVVVPSLYEGFSIISIEAQTSGKFCIVSENVAAEANMELGLIKYLPVESPELWAKEIIKNLDYKDVPKMVREQKLEEKALNNTESANIYRSMLRDILIK